MANSLTVAFPAKGADLQALFCFAGYARKHPLRVIILPNTKRYTGDGLSTELAALGVEGFAVEVPQLSRLQSYRRHRDSSHSHHGIS